MSIESSLSKIGLNEGSTKVYLACLQLGTATITDIAKIAGTKRPTTYLIVDDLLMKGYISSSKKGLKKYYSAEHPSRILQTIRFRVKEMENLLPELEALYNEPKQKPRIRTYEGKEAIKNIYDELYAYLDKKEEALFFTSVGDLQKYFPEALVYYMSKLRSGKDYRIRELNIGDTEGIAYVQKMKALLGKQHQIRLLDPVKFYFQGTDNFIFGNKLIILSVKRDILAIVIENENIADTYRTIFNAAWEAAVVRN